ncbi:hypothetical protein C6499_15910 [Candidatus Poribacteria bacterium]|nr:MAG: hypothetical protein C6499_15910 [Candidatus Poribacteria bacterium]
MDDLIHKKVILSLLDSDTKSANEIADEIGQPSVTVEHQLTILDSAGICEKVSNGEMNQYVVKKDIETFAQLVKEFLLNKEKHTDQIEQFITSEYYLNRIDDKLVDYVLNRFYLNSVYQDDETKMGIQRILLASPSGLLFALYGDTTIFSESQSNWERLDSSDETREWFTQILHSQFMTPLLEMLIADMKVTTYGFLYAKLQLQVAQVSIHVNVATVHGKYVEAAAGGSFTLLKAAEALRAGHLTSAVDPMIFCDNGVALLHLREFQMALESFDKALNAVPNPIQKAIVLNNKGWAFLNLKQYQKAIECFEEGIAFDPEGEISLLRENKQVAEEYLVRATDADNLTDPTQIRFVQDQPVPFEETRLYEFKEVKGRNPANRITKDADEYTVAFLNSEGGRIFWGVRDSDRTTVGVTLNDQKRDEVRRIVSEKLGSIDPPVSVEDWHLELHQVYNFEGETIEDLWVVELLVLPPQERGIFYTNSGELFVKTPGGKQKLSGPQVTEFIRSRFQNDTETD